MAIFRRVNREVLESALVVVNQVFGDNVIWNREPDYQGQSRGGGETWACTLRVQSSKGPGHRLSVPLWRDRQRRLVAACWHVYGAFFDAVLELAPGAIIVTSTSEGKRQITADGGNWHDFDIGSIMFPFYASDACECDHDILCQLEMW